MDLQQDEDGVPEGLPGVRERPGKGTTERNRGQRPAGYIIIRYQGEARQEDRGDHEEPRRPAVERDQARPGKYSREAREHREQCVRTEEDDQ
eukprot:5764351-Heterocapsa_arctica.AAC.1